jgi:multidrug/hemolysin transport system permease protein
MSSFTGRNLKLFFRDKSAVFFSLLSIFIVIALYILFLRDVWVGGWADMVPDIAYLMDSWLVSGLLAIVSTTATMGAFGIMIDDRVKRIDKDLYASPVKRSVLLQGYLVSALIIGIVMSLITFALAELYIVLNGGALAGAVTCLKILGVVILSALTNTSIMCFVVSFFVSQQAYSTASTIIGTLIGFLTGVYLPVGALPASVQTVIKLFPVSHAASLFRILLMDAPLNMAFAGLNEAYRTGFQEYMGVTYVFGDYTVKPWLSVVILAGTALVFYLLAVWNLSRMRAVSTKASGKKRI